MGFPCMVVTGMISTHTLTWSVTICISLQSTPTVISTHTLTWSVTLLFQYLVETFGDFNSHAHVERDLLFQYLVETFGDFNSHAHVERDT